MRHLISCVIVVNSMFIIGRVSQCEKTVSVHPDKHSYHVCKHTVGSIIRIICVSQNEIMLISIIQGIKNIIYRHAFIITAPQGWMLESSRDRLSRKNR